MFLLVSVILFVGGGGMSAYFCLLAAGPSAYFCLPRGLPTRGGGVSVQGVGGGV